MDLKELIDLTNQQMVNAFCSIDEKAIKEINEQLPDIFWGEKNKKAF